MAKKSNQYSNKKSIRNLSTYPLAKDFGWRNPIFSSLKTFVPIDSTESKLGERRKLSIQEKVLLMHILGE